MANGHRNIRALGYSFPQVPICDISGKWAQGHLGYPFRALGVPLSPKRPFAPSAHLPRAHLKTFGENGHKALAIPC